MSPPASHLASEVVLAIDLLQGRILARTFSSRMRETVRSGVDSLVLKGGLALRLAQDHLRHTADIDLDADPTYLPPKALRRIVGRAIREATVGLGLADLVVSESKQTDTVARWKINASLPGSGSHLHMKVEVSFRNLIDGKDVRTIEQDHVLVPVYRDETLLFNKVEALVGRDAFRDVADCYILFEAGVMPSLNQVRAFWPEERIRELAEIFRSPDGAGACKIDDMATDTQRFQDQIHASWGRGTPPSDSQWIDMCMFVRSSLSLMFEAALAGHEALSVMPPVVLNRSSSASDPVQDEQADASLDTDFSDTFTNGFARRKLL
jgi:hypothetical protein